MELGLGFLQGQLAMAADGQSQIVQPPEQNSLEHAFAENERRFQSLLGALPAAVYTTDEAGRITYFNEAAAELWGRRPDIGTSEWCGSWRLYRPDGTHLPHDECPMALALKENRSVRGCEAIAERPDGTRVPFMPFPTPLYDDEGKLVGAVNMLVDITERKKAEEQQSLLVRELHHRVKNTLATVQAIMGSTARESLSVEDFQKAFISRIGSLAKTHALLTDDLRQSVSFRDLLRNELDVFDDGSRNRLSLSGPEVQLPSDLAVPLGMAVHELTTNAAKYGALSKLGGRVEVSWSPKNTPSGPILEFMWLEQGGPPVTEPSHIGFGSRLLQQVLAGQIRAKIHLDYNPNGLRGRFAIPLG